MFGYISRVGTRFQNVELNIGAIRSSSSSSLRSTCLGNFHKARQARMEPFAGYMMPIVYKNQSIKQEHLHCRESACAFDVSHMMQTIISGKDRYRFMESLTVADTAAIKLDGCTLSVLTNDRGGIIDDCIISNRSDHLHVVSNAGNAEKVWSWLNSNLNSKMDVKLERLDGRGLIALQGPKAAHVLGAIVPSLDLTSLKFMNTTDTLISGIGSCQVTRCGYTGEDGFEISVDSSKAETLMTDLCKNDLVLPAGLGARDTLRLEAGLCLHGHDISEETTPVEANLTWTIHKRRRQEGGFPGFEAIKNQLTTGTEVRRVGLIALTSGPPAREGSKIESEDGKVELGKVTSGNFAPNLSKNIAMAYVRADYSKKVGEKVTCEVRGKSYGYQICRMPFVETKYYVK